MLSTTERSVPSTALTWEPLPTPARRRWPWIVTPVALVMAVVIASFSISLPYYRIAPGSARAITSLVSVPEERSFPPEGAFLLTTVSLGETRAVDAFLGWLDPDVDVVPRDQVVPPDTTGQEFLELNRLFMEQSKQAAIVVALRRLGFAVPEQGEGAIVAGVGDDLPATGKLSPGDVIVGVDGQQVMTSSDAVRIIRTHAPGDTIPLQVRPGGREGEPVPVELVAAEHPDEPGQPLIGVQLRTHKQRFDMPFPVSIDSQNIGGPSAGLAFTLSVIDLLTAGELSGGQPIAVTGTIELDGTVGRVGGVAQKAAAVKESGVGVFIVPKAEEALARAHAGDVEVIGVDTLEEALTALGQVGGDVAALAPSGAEAGG